MLETLYNLLGGLFLLIAGIVEFYPHLGILIAVAVCLSLYLIITHPKSKSKAAAHTLWLNHTIRGRLLLFAVVAFCVVAVIVGFAMDLRLSVLKAHLYPESVADKTDLPQEQWDAFLADFADRWEDSELYRLVAGDSATFQYDFVRTRGRWFAVILSKRDESECMYRGWIGAMDVAGESNVPLLPCPIIRSPIRGSELERYHALLAADSLWALFGKQPEWNSAREFKLERHRIASLPRVL